MRTLHLSSLGAGLILAVSCSSSSDDQDSDLTSPSAGGGGVVGAGGLQTLAGGTSGVAGGGASGGNDSELAGGAPAVGGADTASGGVESSVGGASESGGGSESAGGASSSSGGNADGAGGNPGGSKQWLGAVSPDALDDAADEYESWHQKYFLDCGDGTACIEDASQGRCVSEGIGYGMLAAVSADDQATFDKLWAYYLKWSNENGVMDWSIARCEGNRIDTGGAADAELDAAYSLLQAGSRWGEASYGADATTLITAVKDHETETCDGRIILKPGDKWGGCQDPSDTKINPSYFAPAYYKAFAQHVPEQADHWTQMVDGTYELFEIYQARPTKTFSEQTDNSLIPDWSDADGADWYEAGYGYESVRAPWRIAVDYGLTADPRAKAVLEKLDGFISSEGGPGPLCSNLFARNSAFCGSFAMPGVLDDAAMVADYRSWVDTEMDDTPYYQGTLRVLFIQAAAGIFYVP